MGITIPTRDRLCTRLSAGKGGKAVNAAKGPRLYLRAAARGRREVWIIRDGARTVSTGCDATRRADAERRLADYLRQPKLVDRQFLAARLDLARRRAVRKGRAFNLTVDDLRDILERQEWKCALTGLPFDLTAGQPWSRPRALAIDRIDSREGYLLGNVRLVLHAINVAIGPWGEDEFAAIALAFSAQRAPKRPQPVTVPVCRSAWSAQSHMRNG